jgi:hypothetical protein
VVKAATGDPAPKEKTKKVASATKKSPKSRSKSA